MVHSAALASNQTTMATYDLTKMLFKLEEILEHLRLITQETIDATTFERITEDLETLYDELQEYTDIVVSAGMQANEKGECL